MLPCGTEGLVVLVGVSESERGMRAFGLWPCSISMSGSQTSHFSSHTSAFSDKCCHIPAALGKKRARRVIVRKSQARFLHCS